MRVLQLLVGSLALVLVSLAIRADENTPEDILQGKGLTKVASQYLLEADANLPQAFRDMRAAQHRVDIALAQRGQIEREIQAAESQIRDWEAQQAAVAEQLSKTKKKAVVTYNQLVNESNALQAKLREGPKLVEMRRKDLQAIGDPSDEYIDSIIKLSDALESAAAGYEKLASDKDVAHALEAINASLKSKLKLGPSSQFTAELPGVRKLRQTVISTAIKLDMDVGVPQALVTLNGSAKVKMVVDSGAATVTLTSETANRLGLLAAKGDKIISLVSADGKVTEAHVKVLKSIKIGPFTVENVECAVQPASVKGSVDLLGGTFLQHFTYRMDLAARELHLSQISGRPAFEASRVLPTTAPITAADGRTAASHPTTNLAMHPAPVLPHSTFAVPADRQWTLCEMEVIAGKCYRVTARGKWTNATGVECGPQGVCPEQWLCSLGPQPGMPRDQADAWYVGQHPRSALIARINDDKTGFYIGSDQMFLAPVSGHITFQMNDWNTESTVRSGKLQVTMTEIQPHWLDDQNRATIFARIDVEDFLHITPEGIFWEWGGHNGRVGEHSGHYPTIINGIYWWPKWIDKNHTDTFAAPGLRPSGQVRLAMVMAKRGSVDLDQSPASEVILRFRERGFGSSQVGCLVSFPPP